MKAKELGQFLRHARERIRVDSRTRQARRTPGLRREEVAAAADISVTWYTWIEQGRAEAVSAAVLARLADVLILSDPERQYLADLAGGVSRASTPLDAPAVLPAMMKEILAPAYCLDRHWTAVAWNAQAASLFPAWLGPNARERNLLAYMFLTEEARLRIVDWEERALRLVAEFATDAHDLEGDALYVALRDRLSAASTEFCACWGMREVTFREPRTKLFRTQGGLCAYEQTTLQLMGQRDIKVVILTPAGH
ncbi:MAG: helix-turn-helix transcriptional regulator [Gammaproteobacteria bacterium]|nr:helix-turn-helix transcriptional regulator [Gammaproteobacteria bacterium]